MINIRIIKPKPKYRYEHNELGVVVIPIKENEQLKNNITNDNKREDLEQKLRRLLCKQTKD